MKGLSVTKNPMGITAVRLHYSAHPGLDPEHPDIDIREKALQWLEKQKSLYPDPNAFEAEFEINFFVGAGTRVFPQFSQTHHCRPIDFNRRRVIYRGWDFGWHAPVCLIAQVDSKERICFLREIVGSKQTTHDFANHVVQKCAEWYPLHAAGYEDYCDPAGQQVKTIESEKSERRDIEILAGLGIHPRYEHGWSRKDGRTLVHRLLSLRSDGTPGLYVDDSSCATLAQAFLGRYVYPVTNDGRTKEEPDDQTHPWADVMAAVRYLATGLQAKLGLRRYRFGQGDTQTNQLPPVAYHGYGTPVRK